MSGKNVTELSRSALDSLLKQAEFADLQRCDVMILVSNDQEQALAWKFGATVLNSPAQILKMLGSWVSTIAHDMVKRDLDERRGAGVH